MLRYRLEWLVWRTLVRGGAVHPGGAVGDAGQDRAVQVNPIKPTLKVPGSERLKLNCDDLHSNFAFKFNLRRYTKRPPPLPPPNMAGLLQFESLR